MWFYRKILVRDSSALFSINCLGGLATMYKTTMIEIDRTEPPEMELLYSGLTKNLSTKIRILSRYLAYVQE